jgi:Holliday junction resolvase RusA-like endonuclease
MLRLAAQNTMDGREPSISPERLELKVTLPIPKSWSKKKHMAVIGDILPSTKPDLSNLLKLSEDALSGVVFSSHDALAASSTRKKPTA